MGLKSTVLAFASSLIGLGLMAAPVSAAPGPVSQQIKVTATVQPAHTVIVDDSGEVRQIVSNTSLRTIEPKVYVDKVSVDTARPLTAELRASIAELIRDKAIRPGVMYDRTSVMAVTEVKPADSIMRIINSKIFNLR